ncbi:MAG: formylglycine-generating enzyme family protein [Phormidesmis sp. RL_2_1]|nr:formylglycine-generating enzyme family protein [Phormidesmis sp. RL_2_1]
MIKPIIKTLINLLHLLIKSRTKPISKGFVVALFNLSLVYQVGCQAVVDNSVRQTQITQETCERQAGFTWVAGGDFIAGSDTAERDYAYRISAEGFANSSEQVAQIEAGYRAQGWFDREPERRKLSLPPFCLSENLITNADYQVFVRATGHRVPDISAADYQAQGFLVHSYAEVEPYLWQGDRYPAGKGEHPVVLVSYEDALAYAAWRSQRDGVSYRLPTALEWEKAARGPDGRYFPWGNEWRNDATNWAKNGPYGTSAIATFPASRSPYGIEDMAGNVFEYTSTLTDVPDNPEVILKGCGWDDYPGFCRAAYQHDRPVNSRHILFGFRLLLE